jgi:type VI secretion system protein ImpC
LPGVFDIETDEKLKIRFMDISKDEVRRMLRRFKGIAWDQSPLFKRVYEKEASIGKFRRTNLDVHVPV